MKGTEVQTLGAVLKQRLSLSGCLHVVNCECETQVRCECETQVLKGVWQYIMANLEMLLNHFLPIVYHSFQATLLLSYVGLVVKFILLPSARMRSEGTVVGFVSLHLTPRTSVRHRNDTIYPTGDVAELEREKANM